MTVNDSQPIRSRIQNVQSLRGPVSTSHRLRQSPHVGGSDPVVISPELFELGAFMEGLRALPDIREALLPPIQSRIASHELDISGDRVATRVVKETVLNTLSIR